MSLLGAVSAESSRTDGLVAFMLAEAEEWRERAGLPGCRGGGVAFIPETGDEGDEPSFSGGNTPGGDGVFSDVLEKKWTDSPINVLWSSCDQY